MESSILTFIFHWVLKLGSIEQGYTFVVVVVVFGTHLFQFSFSFLFLFFSFTGKHLRTIATM